MHSSNLAANWDGPPPATLMISGYLLKRSDTIRRWNKRWCSLDPTLGRIEYRINQNDRQPKGYMNFDGTTGVTVPPMNLHGAPEYEGCCIYVTVPRQRKEYFLTAESPELAAEWVSKICSVIAIMSKHEAAVAALKGQPPPQRPYVPQALPRAPPTSSTAPRSPQDQPPPPPPYPGTAPQGGDPRWGAHAPPPSEPSSLAGHHVPRGTSPSSSISSPSLPVTPVVDTAVVTSASGEDINEEARQALVMAALMGARSASLSSSSSSAASGGASSGLTVGGIGGGDVHADASSPVTGADVAAAVPSSSASAPGVPPTQAQGGLDGRGGASTAAHNLPSQETLLALLARRDQELKDAQAVATAARNAATDAASVAERCARACREMEERLSLQERRNAAAAAASAPSSTTLGPTPPATRDSSIASVHPTPANASAGKVGGAVNAAALAGMQAQRDAAVAESRQTKALLAEAERKLGLADRRVAEAERRAVEAERKASEADKKAKGIEEAAAVALRGSRVDSGRLEAEVEALRRDRDRAVVALDQERRLGESAQKDMASAQRKLELAEKQNADLRQSLAAATAAVTASPSPPPAPAAPLAFAISATSWGGPSADDTWSRSDATAGGVYQGGAAYVLNAGTAPAQMPAYSGSAAGLGGSDRSVTDVLRRATESVLGPCGLAEEDLVRLTHAISRALRSEGGGGGAGRAGAEGEGGAGTAAAAPAAAAFAATAPAAAAGTHNADTLAAATASGGPSWGEGWGSAAADAGSTCWGEGVTPGGGPWEREVVDVAPTSGETSNSAASVPSIAAAGALTGGAPAGEVFSTSKTTTSGLASGTITAASPSSNPGPAPTTQDVASIPASNAGHAPGPFGFDIANNSASGLFGFGSAPAAEPSPRSFGFSSASAFEPSTGSFGFTASAYAPASGPDVPFASPPALPHASGEIPAPAPASSEAPGGSRQATEVGSVEGAATRLPPTGPGAFPYAGDGTDAMPASGSVPPLASSSFGGNVPSFEHMPTAPGLDHTPACEAPVHHTNATPAYEALVNLANGTPAAPAEHVGPADLLNLVFGAPTSANVVVQEIGAEDHALGQAGEGDDKPGLLVEWADEGSSGHEGSRGAEKALDPGLLDVTSGARGTAPPSLGQP